MTSERRMRLLLGGIIVAALAGAIDATIGRVWDLLAILIVIVALAVTIALSASTGRSSVTLRADLFRWLHHRSSIGGEPIEATLDRSIATYRDHFLPEGPK